VADTVQHVLRSRQAQELLRFLVVGVSVVSVDFAVYFLLLRSFPQVPVSTAKVLSFLAGAALAFVLNRSFVFRAGGAATRQLVAFALLYACSLALNTGANWVALSIGFGRPFSWLVATGTSTVSNFLGMKLLVFRRKDSFRD